MFVKSARFLTSKNIPSCPQAIMSECCPSLMISNSFFKNVGTLDLRGFFLDVIWFIICSLVTISSILIFLLIRGVWIKA